MPRPSCADPSPVAAVVRLLEGSGIASAEHLGDTTTATGFAVFADPHVEEVVYVEWRSGRGKVESAEDVTRHVRDIAAALAQAGFRVEVSPWYVIVRGRS